MFSLYYNKRDKEMIIEPIRPSSFMYSKCSDTVTIFNDCYFMCTDRKLLREKANEIKNKWIEEAEKELNGFKKLKLKNKY